MNSVAYDKAFSFALDIIELYKNLTLKKREYVLSKQILRSGTSIGANIKEGINGQSKKDFLSKISIALKEAEETEYWIELLRYSNYIDDKTSSLLLENCKEIIKILVTTIKTTKINLKL
ncbi:TPA: four helix bundle protein [Clostridium botulinum]|uniref:four helix bundle protein n=1 Tax=Clostridium botulinum TaxID=1491 RepID=UPI0009B1BDFB|nr:four helix bundle protein [Clostridium botulinum]HCL4444708.1 four helix bundle protein [Clostridium botulinum]HCL4456195.1 four helix bundle protein [Clostridium botulinum]HCL4459880.1 four helix bundle protein [Clostridium botulinum]HCL4470934.1 four helix bundle protein [Clostridium botulinum]HCL4474535.1 four helix bundle protein [Clostridium botulinum]